MWGMVTGPSGLDGWNVVVRPIGAFGVGIEAGSREGTCAEKTWRDHMSERVINFGNKNE